MANLLSNLLGAPISSYDDVDLRSHPSYQYALIQKKCFKDFVMQESQWTSKKKRKKILLTKIKGDK